MQVKEDGVVDEHDLAVKCEYMHRHVWTQTCSNIPGRKFLAPSFGHKILIAYYAIKYAAFLLPFRYCQI